jgi:hypothetical protein
MAAPEVARTVPNERKYDPMKVRGDGRDGKESKEEQSGGKEGLTENAELRRVRDILFGKEIESLEKKITESTDLGKKVTQALRAEIEARVDAIERAMIREVELLTTRLRSESNERQSLRERFTAEIDRLKTSTGELESRKVSREALAKMLTDVVGTLKSEDGDSKR